MMAKKIKKFAGGGVYGPPASAAGPREYSSGTASPYSLGSGSNYFNMGNAGGATGFSVRPAILSGMPGFKFRQKFAKGGDVSPAEAVHKHEKNMHKGKPLTKMAKGGSASKRADGCAQRGKTKGKMV